MRFQYFGYGSNMNLIALRAKGVEPLRSAPAELGAWRLCFNVRHWFRHEGGVANIEPSNAPNERLLGVVHLCEDETLDDIREGRISEAGRIYLNEYLHEFAREFTYVGRYRYH